MEELSLPLRLFPVWTLAEIGEWTSAGQGERRNAAPCDQVTATGTPLRESITTLSGERALFDVSNDVSFESDYFHLSTHIWLRQSGTVVLQERIRALNPLSHIL